MSATSLAETGEATAALEHALALDAGSAGPRDAAGAAAAYSKAADLGVGVAHLRLGRMHETADGVAHDPAAARRCYEAALAAGVIEAHLHLALCHLEGWGGPVDRPAFVRELTRGAEAGHLEAQRILSAIYAVGVIVPRDLAAAVRWAERAALEDDAVAQHQLGLLAEATLRRAGTDKLARTWYTLAAEQEYTAAMISLARTFLTGQPAGRDWELGRRWLEAAAEAGDREAPLTLAVLELFHVDSPQRSESRARDALMQASAAGNARATEILELAGSGRSLPDAVRSILTEAFADRYVAREAQKAGSDYEAAADRPPLIYRMVPPIYPLSQRLVEETGEVTVDFVVDVHGQVEDAKVLVAPHPLFAERAVEAVQQWRFHPARKNGRAVKTRMRVPVVFNITPQMVPSVDALMAFARGRAGQLGPEALADVEDLRMARPIRGSMRAPEGGTPPRRLEGKVMMVLRLDPSGKPLRGRVLQSSDPAVSEPVLAAALAARFEPVLVAGAPVEGRVLLLYSFKAGATTAPLLPGLKQSPVSRGEGAPQ